MKSPMVEAATYLSNKNGYTDLQVLRSAAGYYIGTLYNEYDPETGVLIFQEPGSRDSDYFATEEGAAAYLKCLEAGTDEDAAQVLRMTP